MTGGTRLRWDAAAGRLEASDDPGQLVVADSWLVADGQLRAFAAHTRRFSAACAALLGTDPRQAREFMDAAAALMPARGRWFPRAELTLVSGTPQLQLWLRPAPAPGRTVRLWLSPVPDRRTQPRVKGPDLDWLARQRAAAMAAGADEAVLLSADGRVLEGATTSILWWRGSELCAPAEEDGVLPGVTRLILFDLAASIGAPIVASSPKPAELDGLEVWAVNALHGIRPVTGWVGADITPGPARRAARWQCYLDEFAVPVSSEHGREPAVGSAAHPGPPA